MNIFDDIRPYNDSETVSAMKRIAGSPVLPLIASFVFPGSDTDAVRNRLLEVTGVDDFQSYFMDAFNRRVISGTISSFTFSGMEHISGNTAYTFISNHRDIVLDASLLAQILYESGAVVPEITFGSNLMSDPLVVDLGKCNRMFRVVRKHSSREFLRESAHLSAYMRSVISSGRSVWIAQRNGRTKDGKDRTDSGLLKMMSMSGPLEQLGIVPVAVSYEYEPCADMKAAELYVREISSGEYVKEEGEDLRSIVSGITGYKGKCHIAVAQPLTQHELGQCSEGGRNALSRNVAVLLDRRITGAYRIMPSNYAARDIVDGSSRHAGFYSPEYMDSFMEYCDSASASAADILRGKGIEPDICRLRSILLGIYASVIPAGL